MKQKLIGLSQRYGMVLRIRLKPGPSASMPPALGLGRQAVALGPGTLGLAQRHERALATLELLKIKNGPLRRAEVFFAQARTPDLGDASRRARSVDRVRWNKTQFEIKMMSRRKITNPRVSSLSS